MSSFSKGLYRFVEVVWKHPKGTLLIIAVITVLFALRVPTVRIVSDFADLLPQDHPYIQLHKLTCYPRIIPTFSYTMKSGIPSAERTTSLSRSPSRKERSSATTRWTESTGSRLQSMHWKASTTTWSPA